MTVNNKNFFCISNNRAIKQIYHYKSIQMANSLLLHSSWVDIGAVIFLLIVLVSVVVHVPVVLFVPYYYCVPGVVLNPLPLCNLYTCISWCVVVVSVPYYLVHCSLFLFLFFCCCSMIIPIIVYQEWIQGVCLNNIAVPVPVPYPFPVHLYCSFFFILLFH